MNDPALIDAFNDCIDRLAGGESLENCLRRYPEYARALRPMLEAGLAVRRAQILPFETDAAEVRVRARLIDALAQPARRPARAINRLLPLVATLILVFGAVIGGSALLSRITQPDVTPTSIPVESSTASPTFTATHTPSATPSPTTTGTPSATASATSSATPSETASATPTSSAIWTPTPTETAAGCVVSAPEGWSSYRIQAGDTLSALAARAGVTVDRIMQVNCLTDIRLIVVGQQLFLPPLSAPTQVSVPQPPPGGGNDNDQDDHGGNDNDNDHDEDDDHGNDNDDD